ncbi:hypothetical protein ACFPRL_20350 [Pseudoclavibacter helvolus]
MIRPVMSSTSWARPTLSAATSSPRRLSRSRTLRIGPDGGAAAGPPAFEIDLVAD